MNKSTINLFQKCEEEGIDPFRALLRFTQHPDPDIALGATKEVCTYLYPKRRAVEVTGENGDPIRVESKQMTMAEIRKIIDADLVAPPVPIEAVVRAAIEDGERDED